MFAKRPPKHKEAAKARLQARATVVKSQEHVPDIEKQELAKEGIKSRLLAKAREMARAKEQTKIEQLEKVKELTRAEMRITSAMLKAMEKPPPTENELERQRRLEKFREIFTFVRFDTDTPILYSVVAGEETRRNAKLMDFKKDLRALDDTRDRVLQEDKNKELQEFWKQRDDRARRNSINERSFFDHNIQLMKEKQQLKELQRQQAREEQERATRRREMHLQEIKNDKERRHKSKKKLFQQIQGDISDKNKQRELNVVNEMVIEEKAKYMQIDLDEKERQKKLEHIRRLEKHQMLIDVTSDKYSVMVMRQALSPTWRNKVQLFQE